MELILAALGHLLARRPPNLATTENAIRFHEEILNAIVNKDRVGAVRLVEAHLKEVETQLKYLQKI